VTVTRSDPFWLDDDANARAPSSPTAEAAAFEFHVGRKVFGDWASKPPINRWRPDQRKRFEAELKRLEAKDRDDAELAIQQSVARPIEEPPLPY
jgi:hypothetical protein